MLTVLTSAAPTFTETVTDSGAGKIASSGSWGGATVNISYALAGAPTVFAALDGASFKRDFQWLLTFPGTKLKFEAIGATGATAINVEVTASV